ncbi:hypothetical protein HK099_004359 [Clydaea vesicula]|uniref:NadR/Ttd14 AAA domain-containing protein n=1 Tax=Clydaea vesicula TaxID=447962 RepID=A0AAD5Y0B8_9FUNG|nr:hypothetical protein HK099_004359 [Clydaea vesicula]
MEHTETIERDEKQETNLYRNLTNENTPFKVICLTGGPCAGKTSCLTILSDLFENLGWKVFRVPETAATLLGGGVIFSELSKTMAYSFQKDLITVMLSMENTYMNLARLSAQNGRKTIVICDRGVMDPSAYIPRDEWLQSLRELNLNESDLRDNRYDAVVHLVTAAKGASQFYSLDNNDTRTEGLELAIELDDKVKNAWNGHAAFTVIDNESVKNFNQKCDKVVQAVINRLGLIGEETKKTIFKRKFLVKNFNWDDKFKVPCREFHVEHVYLAQLSQDGAQVRIRKRQEFNSKGSHSNLTMRHPRIDGQRVETRRNLLPREYDYLKANMDPTRYPIQKKRRCFLFNENYYQLDYFIKPKDGLVLLEAYLDFKDKVGLPDWLELTEVTDDKNYSMYELAKK